METFAELSNDEMAAEITTLAGRLAAGEARQLALIAEFDRREAWGGAGILSCAHWLSWRTQLSPHAARERVRVARALRALPLVAEAFTTGRLSYSQVRAITRVDLGDGGARLIDMARHSTAGQLERIVRGVRRAQRADQPPEPEAQRVQVSTRYDLDGTLVLTVRANAEDGAIIKAALEQARAALDTQRRTDTPAPAAADTAETDDGGVPAGTPDPADSVPDDVAAAARPTYDPFDPGGVPAGTPETDPQPATPPRPAAPAKATLGDAMLALAHSMLDRIHTDHPTLARRHRSQLTVHLDPLSGWRRLPDGEFLPPTPGHLTARDLGRRRRHPTLALRELLAAVDGERCRYPSCNRHRHLHAHHVIESADGGPTDLANLILLCHRHHVLVHRDRHRLTLDPHTRRLTVTTADGTPIPHHPDHPWQPHDDLDPADTITADTLPPDLIDARIDLDHIIWVTLQQAA